MCRYSFPWSKTGFNAPKESVNHEYRRKHFERKHSACRNAIRRTTSYVSIVKEILVNCLMKFKTHVQITTDISATLRVHNEHLALVISVIFTNGEVFFFLLLLFLYGCLRWWWRWCYNKEHSSFNFWVGGLETTDQCLLLTGRLFSLAFS